MARSKSSTRWLQRQGSDPYVARAKAQGYRSRAVFKLQEIQDKYNVITPGQLLSLIHISEPTRHICLSRMPSSA